MPRDAWQAPLTDLENSMYLFFAPATVALVVIGIIQLREQFNFSR